MINYKSISLQMLMFPSSKHADYEKHIREVKEYLEKPEGILVTNMGSFNGAQGRNIIIIVDDDDDFDMIYLRNMIMRTMSFAIIIHKKDRFKQSVPGLVRDDNLHEYIHPGNTEQLFCKNKRSKHRSICNWPIKDDDSASDSFSSSDDSSNPSSDIEEEEEESKS